MSNNIKITVTKSGNFDSEKYLRKALKLCANKKLLEEVARESIHDFIAASPNSDIADRWTYEIVSEKNTLSLFFNNSKIENGQNIAIIIDTGHGTVDGKWVPGTNYLKKPIQNTYERIIEKTWEALKAYER